MAAAAPKALEGGRSGTRRLGVDTPAAAGEEDAPLLLLPPPPPTHNPVRAHGAAPPVDARAQACHVYAEGPPLAKCEHTDLIVCMRNGGSGDLNHVLSLILLEKTARTILVV